MGNIVRIPMFVDVKICGEEYGSGTYSVSGNAVRRLGDFDMPETPEEKVLREHRERRERIRERQEIGALDSSPGLRPPPPARFDEDLDPLPEQWDPATTNSISDIREYHNRLQEIRERSRKVLGTRAVALGGFLERVCLNGDIVPLTRRGPVKRPMQMLLLIRSADGQQIAYAATVKDGEDGYIQVRYEDRLSDLTPRSFPTEPTGKLVIQAQLGGTHSQYVGPTPFDVMAGFQFADVIPNHLIETLESASGDALAIKTPSVRAGSAIGGRAPKRGEPGYGTYMQALRDSKEARGARRRLKKLSGPAKKTGKRGRPPKAKTTRRGGK